MHRVESCYNLTKGIFRMNAGPVLYHRAISSCDEAGCVVCEFSCTQASLHCFNGLPTSYDSFMYIYSQVGKLYLFFVLHRVKPDV